MIDLQTLSELFITDEDYLNLKDQTLGNKIFTTFCKKEDLDTTIDKIVNTYTILHDKLFVFTSPQTEEYIITYNIDTTLASDAHIIENTVLLHRNSQYKVLYSINALKALHPESFDTHGDHRVQIDWTNYAKSILLTRKGVFTRLDTEIFKIVNVKH